MRGECQYLPVEVLEHDGGVQQGGCRVHDLAQGCAFHAEVGEHLVHVTGVTHFVVLLGDDRPVHRLGHFDEPDLSVQRDDRQADPVGGFRQMWRHGVDVAAEFDEHAGRTRFGEALQVAHPDGVVGQRLPGGQHQLPALQQVRHVGHVGDMHPPNGAVERRRADHLRQAGLDDRKRHHIANSALHLQSVNK